MEDAKSRDYSMNALYLQLFPQPMLIDPLGCGYDDARGNILRLACQDTFRSDLSAQFRFWKACNFNKYIIPRVQTDEGKSIPLDQYVDDLIYVQVSKLAIEAKEVIEPIEKTYEEKLNEYFDQLYSTLFKGHTSDIAKKMHEDLKKRNWWQKTIELIHSQAAKQLFGPGLSRTTSKTVVRPAFDTLAFVSWIIEVTKTNEESASVASLRNIQEKRTKPHLDKGRDKLDGDASKSGPSLDDNTVEPLSDLGLESLETNGILSLFL